LSADGRPVLSALDEPANQQDQNAEEYNNDIEQEELDDKIIHE